jgi:hypothetical protein
VTRSPAEAISQAHRSLVPAYRGTGDAFRTILRNEGKLALYRGFRMNLFGLACDPIVIGCIEFTRTRLTYYSERFTPYKDGHYGSPLFRYVLSPTTAITLVSAGGAACVGQIIQVPVDVISQKKQMQMHPLFTPAGTLARTPDTSSIAIARQIIQAEGIRGLYRGFGVTLCSATPFTAILWAVYWPTQRFLHDGLNHHHPNSSSCAPTASPPFCATLPPSSLGLSMEISPHPPSCLELKDLPPGAKLPPEEVEYWRAEQRHEQQRKLNHGHNHTLPHVSPSSSEWSFNWRESVPTPVAAFVASATASLTTQPIDVIKTRFQVHGGVGATVASTVRKLIAERGYRGLCSGWYPRILAVSPGTTIMMSSYELLKRYCQK